MIKPVGFVLLRGNNSAWPASDVSIAPPSGAGSTRLLHTLSCMCPLLEVELGVPCFFWFASGPSSSWSFCYLSSLQHQGRDVPLLTSSDAQAAKVRLRVWLWVRLRVWLWGGECGTAG